MIRLTKSSSWALLIGTGLGLGFGCGGKADASAQKAHAGGAGGASGSSGVAGKVVGPAVHVDECERICARTIDAGCGADDSACIMACATVTGFSGCQSQISAWLRCAESAEVVCDSSGAPTFSGCDEPLAQAAACAAMTPAPKVVQTSCSGYCDQLVSAGCSFNTPLVECHQACGMAGMIVSTCQSSFLEYLNCAAASGESCDTSGQLNTNVCTAQQFVYMGCVLSEIGKATIPIGTGGTTAQ
jgi:hypothetical protein